MLWCLALQNIAEQRKRAEELASAVAAESDKPTKASGVPQPVAPEPAGKVGEKRRNRWDQSNSAECGAVPGHVCQCAMVHKLWTTNQSLGTLQHAQVLEPIWLRTTHSMHAHHYSYLHLQGLRGRMNTCPAREMPWLTASCGSAQQEGQGVGLGCGGGDAVGQPVGRDAGAAGGRDSGALGRDPDARRQPVGRHARARRRGDAGQEEPLGRDPHARQGTPAPADPAFDACRQCLASQDVAFVAAIRCASAPIKDDHRNYRRLIVEQAQQRFPNLSRVCACRLTLERPQAGRRARRRQWRRPRRGRRGRGGTRRPPSVARGSARRRP